MNKNKLKKIIIIASIGLVLIVGGFLSWEFYFSRQLVFKNQEKEFLDVVERYYSMNRQYLPKKGETRELTLQFLYDGDHINDLYIPKTKKLCDSNSWVRVYNNNGEYEYTTYLKCGKYESKVDHTGPELTLNGSSTQVISIGSTYQELGVKSVIDKVDGPINVSSVTIDSSKVDTSKIGSYSVTYTVRDKAYNKTVVTRTVNVAYSLTDVVKNATDESNYYKGIDVNNYLQFSGMLWRIVNVNEDGSVRIITSGNVTNLRNDYTSYKDSNIDLWLNNEFLNIIHNINYLQESTYCVGNINSFNDYATECDETINSMVGLLNIGGYKNSLVGNSTYLDASNFTLANKVGFVHVDVPNYSDITIGKDILSSIRPVLILKNNLFVTGEGTLEKPYKLDDYSYGKANQLLNTRLIGEYVEYSGLKFRIIGYDTDKNIKMIMAQPWTVQPYNQYLKVSVAELEDVTFNLDEGPGYLLNNDYLDYIDNSGLVHFEYDIPTNISDVAYNKYKNEKISAKVFLPKTYELFAAVDENSENRVNRYLYIDSSKLLNNIFMVNASNARVFELNKSDFYDYYVRPVIMLKNTYKIESGNGTVSSPYRIK